MSPITVRSFTPQTVASKAASSIADLLLKKLSHGKVLVLLSGGSAIAMYQQLFEQLLPKLKNGSDLAVSLLDERYVPVDSVDSNANQLKKTGILHQLETAQVNWWPYLVDNEAGEVVAQRMSKKFTAALTDGWQLIILAGVGDDSHTAGLLPTQDQTTIHDVFETPELVRYYQLPADAENPFRLRLTSTPALMSQASETIVYAIGVTTCLKKVTGRNWPNSRLSSSKFKVWPSSSNSPN